MEMLKNIKMSEKLDFWTSNAHNLIDAIAIYLKDGNSLSEEKNFYSTLDKLSKDPVCCEKIHTYINLVDLEVKS